MDFGEFLDTPQQNKEIDKARLEIRNMLFHCFFPIISMIFLIIYCDALDLTEKQGSGWIMFAFVMIFILWAFVVLHTDKNRKYHLNHYPTEKNPQLSE
jgi:hypothetical protein